jgi:nuclear receptor interaction protein
VLIAYFSLLTGYLITGHPYEPIIAASGIDDTIKIFSPDQRAQDDARRGINILDPNNPANTLGPSAGGLKSAKCMHESYRIMSENDVQRQGGMSDAFVTVCFPFPSFLSSSVAVFVVS